MFWIIIFLCEEPEPLTDHSVSLYYLPTHYSDIKVKNYSVVIMSAVAQLVHVLPLTRQEIHINKRHCLLFFCLCHLRLFTGAELLKFQ